MSAQHPQSPHTPPEYQESTGTPGSKDGPPDAYLHVEDVDLILMDVAEGSHDDHKSEPSPKWSLVHEITFIVIICSAQFLTQAGLGQTVFPLHLIGQSFGPQTPGQLSWYIAAYSLTVGTFILIAGRLGDIFGHKLLLVIGFSWFGFWSLIAGLSVYSHSPIFFDICRSLQGVGPAILLPNSLAVLGRTYPPGRRKEMAFSFFGACAPGGAILGGVFSSLIAERFWWPWAYWCMAILCCLAGGGAFFVIPPTPASRAGDRSFDSFGSITGVAGLVLVNVSWNQAPVVGWHTPYVIVLLILGVILLVAFFMIEMKVSQPLVPFKALSSKAGFVLGCVALGWSSFGIWLLYLVQFLQVLRNVTPLESAAQFVPCAIVGFIAALVTGFLLSRVRTSYIMAVAMTSFCVGIILPATMPIEQTYWIQTFLSLIITVWGMDMSFPAATILLSNLVPKGQQGVAASLVATVVNYSISIGLGIAGTVESHVSEGGKEVLRGYRGAWYAGIGLSGLGVLLSVCFIVVERRKPADTLKT
ncbi:Low affinity NH4+ transporter [Sticta canariensis]|nr:Low affinity NH4+ transporter [Sticta canariensis]